MYTQFVDVLRSLHAPGIVQLDGMSATCWLELAWEQLTGIYLAAALVCSTQDELSAKPALLDADRLISDWCEVKNDIEFERVFSADLERLRALLCAELHAAMCDAEKIPASITTRRRRTLPAKRPVTAAEAEAVQMVGQCSGNKSEAARQLGKHRTTVDQLYKSGMAKAGKTITQRPSTNRLPQDDRGQDSIAAEAHERRTK